MTNKSASFQSYDTGSFISAKPSIFGHFSLNTLCK